MLQLKSIIPSQRLQYILSCILDIAHEILDPQAVNKLEILPMSNNIVQRKICDMTEDFKEQLIEGIRNFICFADQMDEFTNRLELYYSCKWDMWKNNMRRIFILSVYT